METCVVPCFLVQRTVTRLILDTRKCARVPRERPRCRSVYTFCNTRRTPRQLIHIHSIVQHESYFHSTHVHKRPLKYRNLLSISLFLSFSVRISFGGHTFLCYKKNSLRVSFPLSTQTNTIARLAAHMAGTILISLDNSSWKTTFIIKNIQSRRWMIRDHHVLIISWWRTVTPQGKISSRGLGPTTATGRDCFGAAFHLYAQCNRNARQQNARAL